MIRRTIDMTYRVARRIVIAAVGITVLVLGIIMIVTPGPAIVVIPIGLAILGIEFAWARVWLKRMRKSISDMGANGRAARAAAHQDRHNS